MTTEREKPRRPWPSESELLRLRKLIETFTKRCQRCQLTMPMDWQYCAQCGLRLATQCPGCSKPLPPTGGLFCPYCGLEIPQHEAQ